MEQNLNDKPLSNMQIARYIESLRKEMNFDDEVYGLVKSDLDIVNIGLHFFHKDVRLYAASCSEV